MTIQEINAIFKSELRKSNIRIIGDIPFSEENIEILVPKILPELKYYFAFYAGHYMESLCILLVFCAQIEFDGNVYWNYIERRLMPLSPEKRNIIRKQFNMGCNRYELPEFERERLVGHAIITPIICHAGISQSLLEDYFRIYEDALQDAEQSGVLDITEGIFDHFDYRAPVYVRRFLETLPILLEFMEHRWNVKFASSEDKKAMLFL